MLFSLIKPLFYVPYFWFHFLRAIALHTLDPFYLLELRYCIKEQ